MTFFSRPNLEDNVFKQINGTTITLSGLTRIATATGFSISDGTNYVPIIVTGGTNQDVLTYIDGQVVLREPTASGNTGIYKCASPTTVTVGGLVTCSNIYGLGIDKILEEILVPLCNPILTDPYDTLTISPTNSIYEVGAKVTLTGHTIFNNGMIIPAYFGGPGIRSSGVTSYCYNGFGVPLPAVVSSSSANTYVFQSNYPISIGNNSVSVKTYYSCGGQPLNSSGGTYNIPLVASSTTAVQRTVIGVLPWFYGSGSTAPVINQSLINGGCKCISLSTCDITVSNYNVCGKYIWFATPVCVCSVSCSTESNKTRWQACNSPSNCGSIPGDLFSSVCNITVCSPQSCWSGKTYNVYVSNYPTSVNYEMIFKTI